MYRNGASCPVLYVEYLNKLLWKTGLQRASAVCAAVLGSPGGPGEQARQRDAGVVLLRGLPVGEGPRREVPPHIQVGTSRKQ